MSKAVLISIRPEWCEKIANRQKTIEVRKNRPKIDTPFKCYIYCTGRDLHRGLVVGGGVAKQVICCNYKAAIPVGGVIGNGKVIGEFVCDRIIDNIQVEFKKGYYSFDNSMIEVIKDALLFPEQIYEYLKGKQGYGWHISDLVIYDKPRELSEFFVIDKKAVKECSLRERIYTNPDYTNGVCLPGTYICNKDPVDVDYCRGGCWKKSLSRPPQSWCYVEEI